MELRRNIYIKLLAWKKENTGRVLELQGARQVGKTYILKKFGKENFSKMVYINMQKIQEKIFAMCFYCNGMGTGKTDGRNTHS